MNARLFLSNLESFGVKLVSDGDELRIKTQRGASAYAYLDLIRLNKPALLAVLTGESPPGPWITPNDLDWVSVFQGEVDETVPPVDWDHTLPAHCAWPHLCQVLGPCPHVADGKCHCQRRQLVRVVTEQTDARETDVA